MADTEISNLTELVTAADDDLIPIVDTSAGETKYIEALNLIQSSGTFMPRLGATTSDGTHTYVNQAGSYVRIGDMCFFQLQLRVDTLNSSGTITGNLRIKGLPFTAASGNNNVAVSIAWVDDYTVSSGWMLGYIGSGTDNVVLQSTSGASLVNLDQSVLGAGPSIMVSGQYEVA